MTDYNSGVGLNAKIGFYVTNTSNNCQFQVRGRNGRTGSYEIQVRKQKMVIFTGEYSDINTQDDASTPSTQMTDHGLTVSTFLNATKAQALSNDNTGAKEINSEIIFFSGHGGADAIYFQDDTCLYKNEIPSLDRTKVAVWAGCNTANGANSFARKANINGAIVSIGWSTKLNAPSSKIFTDMFFTELNNSRTVKKACETAAGKLLWPWDKAKNYVIYSSTDYILMDQVTWKSSKTSAVRSNASSQQFLKDRMQYQYYTECISDTCTRYIKMFNGRLTNDYYDVYRDGNIVKSNNTISPSDVSRVEQLTKISSRKSTPKVIEKKGYTIIDTEIHNVYVYHNGEVLPVKIISTTYLNQKGFEVLEYNCYNEITGVKIKYEDISFVK